MIQLWKVIHSYFESGDSASNFRSLLTGGLHNFEAPQDVKFPYAVFQLLNNVPTHHASNKNFVEESLIQFNLFSKKSSPVELLQLYDLLVSCFDFASLSVDGYQFLHCVRGDNMQLRIENVWQMNVVYRIWLEPA